VVLQPLFGWLLRKERERAGKTMTELAEYLVSCKYGRYYHATGSDELVRFIWDIEDGAAWPDDHDFFPFVRLCVEYLAAHNRAAARDLVLSAAVCTTCDGVASGRELIHLLQQAKGPKGTP